MASFEQALRVHPLHQTSFDKHKGFTLRPPRMAEVSILSGTFIDLHMGTEPHSVRAFYFPCSSGHLSRYLATGNELLGSRSEHMGAKKPCSGCNAFKGFEARVTCYEAGGKAHGLSLASMPSRHLLVLNVRCAECLKRMDAVSVQAQRRVDVGGRYCTYVLK